MLFLSSLPSNIIKAYAMSGSSTTEQVKQNTQEAKEPEIPPAPTLKHETTNIPVPEVPKKAPMELTTLQTETSETIDNGDGTYSKKIFSKPINRKTENEFKKIVTRLHKGPGDPSTVNDASSDDLVTDNTQMLIRFAPKMKNGIFSKYKYNGIPIVNSLVSENGESGEQTPQNVVAQCADNKVFYKEVFPDVTLRESVFDTSVKEDIILSKYNGYHIFRFHLRTDLDGKVNEDGSVDFSNQENKVIFILPTPLMTDSNINPQSGEPQRSNNVHYELKKDNTGWNVSVVADNEWLKDTSRVYPVYIDPTIAIQTSSDTYVSSAYPTTNYNGANSWDSSLGIYSLKVGFYDSTTGTNYAYLKQDITPIQYATINTALLNVYTAHSYYPTTPTGVWADKVTGGDWNASTLNWNNKPTSSLFTSDSVYQGQWASFNVKNVVQDWVNGTSHNYGFKLHTNGNGQTYWKKFYASENTGSPYLPYLNISYSYPAPAVPTATTGYTSDQKRGYVNLSWNPVNGATGYYVWIFNGTAYEKKYIGNVTNWSSLGKGIWPTDAEVQSGRYQLHINDTSGTDLPFDPSPVYGNSGGKYTTNQNYWCRITAKFANGQESDVSDAVMPTIPLPKVTVPVGSATINSDNNNTGYFSLKWNPVDGATGYKVWIFNGLEYQAIKVGNVTEWSTKGQKIWPTQSEIENGTNALNLHTDDNLSDRTGTELSLDPRPVYKLAGTRYANDLRYYFRVTAYNNYGNESNSLSDAFYTKLTSNDSKLGLEDYFDYETFSNGQDNLSVNLSTNNLVLQSNGIELFNQGALGYTFNRTYNSNSTVESALGKGWTFSGNEFIKEEKNSDGSINFLVFTDSDGTSHDFFLDKSTGLYRQNKGSNLQITRIQNGADISYQLEDQSGIAKTFNTFDATSNKYQLSWYEDKYKNKIEFNYSNGALSSIYEVNSQGNPVRQPITITYSSDGSQIEKVTYNNLTESYTYSGNNLSTATLTYTDKNGHSFSTISNYGYDSQTGILNFAKSGNENTLNITVSGDTVTINQPSLTSVNKDTVVKFNQKSSDNENETSVSYPDGEKLDYVLDSNDINQVVKSFDHTALNDSTKTNTVYERGPHYNITTETVTTTDLNGNPKVIETTAQGYTPSGYQKSSTKTTEIFVDGTPSVTTDYDEKIDYVVNTGINMDTDPFVHNSDITKKITTEADGKSTTESTSGFTSTITQQDDSGTSTTTYVYNSNGTINEIDYPDSVKEDYSYEEGQASNTLKITLNKFIDGKNSSTVSTTYDEYGQISENSDEKGQVTGYNYNPIDDNLISVVNAKGVGYSYEYYSNGGLKQIQSGKMLRNFDYYSDGKIKNKTVKVDTGKSIATGYEYTAIGDIQSVTNQSGKKTNYIYDENGNKKTIQFFASQSDKLPTKQWDLTYEGTNLKTVSTSGNTVKTFNYTDGQLTSISDHLRNVVIGLNEDSENQTKNMNFTLGDYSSSQTAKYDENQNKTQLDYTLNNNNFNASFTNSQNSAVMKSGNITRNSELNSQNRLLSISYSNAENELIKWSYGYDLNGNIENITKGSSNVSYEYDSLNELKNETYNDGLNITYSYDDQGNRTSREVIEEGTTRRDTYTYNDGNQITTKNGIAYDYDADGNLIQDENFKYKYDESNQLITVTKLDGTIVADYEYDENGMRTKKIVGNTQTDFFYNNNILIGETIKDLTTGKITQIHEFLYDNNGLPLGFIQTEIKDDDTKVTSIFNYVTNYRGDVIKILDQSGHSVADYSYDAYGNILSQTGSLADLNPIRYAGYYYDNEATQYYLKSRYYDPSNGNFKSLDKSVGVITDPLSLNGYSYVQNNPVIYFDPNGSYKMPWGLLLYPGEIHNQVVKHIYNEYKNQGIEKEVILATGRADLLDVHTGEIWDVKPKTVNRNDGVNQVKRYTQSSYYYLNGKKNKKKLKAGKIRFDYTTFYYKDYEVKYWHEPNHPQLVLYDFKLNEQGEEDLNLVLSAMTLALLLSLAPELAPALALE